MDRLVGVDRRGPAARLELRWPEKRNALSLKMMEALEAALRRASGDARTRAVVLAARGPAWSAGHFLPELVEADARTRRRVFDACRRLMATVQELPQPVIAEVRTTATAAGCQLVAACDLAVAAEGASFATPGVRIGLFCSTPMVQLSRTIGRKHALEMLLTGDFVDARTALSWGLVNRVVDPGRLEAASQHFAERIAAASPRVVARGKRAFYRQIAMPLPEAAEAMSAVMCDDAAEPDAREGMRAFLEKRPPRWTQEVGAASGCPPGASSQPPRTSR